MSLGNSTSQKWFLSTKDRFVTAFQEAMAAGQRIPPAAEPQQTLCEKRLRRRMLWVASNSAVQGGFSMSYKKRSLELEFDMQQLSF